jgi:ADP-heptose:LPS heptosyltransferase
LVTRTDHLGDLVVSTPALKALRRHLPQAQIWCLVARPAVGLAQNWADTVLTPADPLPSNLDAALGLSPRSATYRLLSRTRARYRIGYTYAERPLARLNCWMNLTHCWVTSLQKPLRQGLKVPHEAEVVAHFLEATGLGPVEVRPEFPLSPAMEQWGKDKVGGRTVIHFAARWGRLQDFCEMARRLAPAVVTYGPQEKVLLPETLPALEGVEWLGDLSLPQWAAVLGGGRALVSTDTGAVHLAAARGTPVVVVHLPQHFALCSQQWYPWGVPQRSLQHGPHLTERVVAAVGELIMARSNRQDLPGEAILPP